MSQNSSENPVIDNVGRSRFELVEQGLTAFADYRREPGRLIIPHVEAPPALRGAGTAGRLMKGVAEQARSAGETIVPLCGYAAAWLRRHPEYEDLVD